MAKGGERFASICSVSNCAEYQMEKLNGRKGGCDYDNIDKNGRMAKGGPGHSPEECDKWCESKPECVFNSRTSNGYCHGFKTCNYQPKGTGIVTNKRFAKARWSTTTMTIAKSFWMRSIALSLQNLQCMVGGMRAATLICCSKIGIGHIKLSGKQFWSPREACLRMASRTHKLFQTFTSHFGDDEPSILEMDAYLFY